MSDFETMKKKMIEENEKNFGEEIRENYGDDVYETSNNILAGLTEEQWRRSEMLRIKAEDLLQELTPGGDSTGERAMEMAKLHGQWASCFWENGEYSPQAHLAIAQMYVDDDRFRSYYEGIVKGGARFLYDAVKHYVEKLDC